MADGTKQLLFQTTEAGIPTQDAMRALIDWYNSDLEVHPEKSILSFIENHAGCKSGEIAKKLAIPNPTVKRILPELLEKNFIEKHGTGPGTNYSIK